MLTKVEDGRLQCALTEAGDKLAVKEINSTLSSLAADATTAALLGWEPDELTALVANLEAKTKKIRRWMTALSLVE